ncbi:PTS sugar transporter IIB, partial [Salmonella enterica]|nr:PTS sugar transporter IIB [Salmonella enterica]EBU5233508.1 PTS sugar transporter IIB [Salmonella enterica subsp. enterica]HCZ4633375.1 PTS sugar transporter IIB [Salmonella enterica subsp. enterica serovar Saintpaul str. CFSAN004120]EAT9114644.1 PTS sugar transporter IIB [Salmonella enterica]EBP7964726.1 PTS sugar transporter IIB [Salmonella enterica]
MKDSVNILFVCGYGVGSSVMLQTVVKKALA